MTHNRRFIGALGLAAVSLALSSSPGLGDSVAEFYKSRSVTMIIASGTGGGYDTYARMLIPYLRKHLPGNPNIVPQNMPGAGGNQAPSFVYSIAPKDGSVILAAQRDSIVTPILGNAKVDFDPPKFGWIGSLNSEQAICGIWHTSKVKTFEDLRTTQVIVGGNGPNSTEFIPALLNHAAGAKFKLIAGYPDGSATTLAVERGETEGWCGWSYSSLERTHPEWIKDGKINVIVQTSLTKNPKLPNVPMIMDVLPNDDAKQMMELLLAPQVTGRPFAAPPSIPADRLAALRAAFDASTVDPDFIADIKKRRLEFSPIKGEDIQTLIDRIYSARPELVAQLKEIIKGQK